MVVHTTCYHGDAKLDDYSLCDTCFAGLFMLHLLNKLSTPGLPAQSEIDTNMVNLHFNWVICLLILEELRILTWLSDIAISTVP